MRRYRNPALAVDALVPRKDGLLLVRRGKAPFSGSWALPGGFVEYGETVEDAVARELFEETGLRARSGELLGVYSDPRRDPRCHTVSVVFIVRAEGRLKAGDDASEARFQPFDKLPKLAFDHESIIGDYLELRKNSPS